MRGGGAGGGGGGGGGGGDGGGGGGGGCGGGGGVVLRRQWPRRWYEIADARSRWRPSPSDAAFNWLIIDGRSTMSCSTAVVSGARHYLRSFVAPTIIKVMPTGTVAKEQQNITSEPPLPPPFAMLPRQTQGREKGLGSLLGKRAESTGRPPRRRRANCRLRVRSASGHQR